MPARSVIIRDLVSLTAVALVVRVVSAWLVPAPPHVDAAYYTMVGEQLAIGNGFSAPALWSFLEVGGRLPANPDLPVPSNGHWMPLTAIVSGAFMTILGPGWRAGQVPMVLLSTLLVPLTYLAAWQVSRSRRVAVLSAILAITAGSLLLMYPLIESFAIFGVLGAITLLASVRAMETARPGPWLVLAGAAAGGASLTRIDGVLLTLAPATAWLLLRPFGTGHLGSPIRALGWGWLSAMAFLVVVIPWLIRDVVVFGTAFPSPGGRLLWIRDYNEHLSISLNLSLERYLAWGLPAILLSKLAALVAVLGRTLALMGGVFGLYFLAGLWMQRRNRRLAPVTVYLIAMFATMILLATEHAPKGAFLHTAPAWLPFALPMAVSAVVPASTAIGRVWPFLRRSATHRFLEVVAVVGAVVLALIGALILLGQWQVRFERQEAAATFLRNEAAPGDVILADDPSSLYLRTGLHGVAPPFDPYPVLERVIESYGVDWVVVTLGPDETMDPLGLWEGGSAADALGNEATFLPDAPAFEADGVRVFKVDR
ncbi:MAG: phospholipid carrier-dependent glycosyltransferase [Candidatus Limnocylindria bacterium]